MTIEEKMLERFEEMIAPLVAKMTTNIPDVSNGSVVDGFVSKNAAAKFLDVSPTWIELRVKEGKLKQYYLDGKHSVRYKIADVENLVKTSTAKKDGRKPKVVGKGRKTKRGMKNVA